MASLLYKNHLILSTADLTATTGKWTADILIGWRTDARWDFQSIKPTDQFDYREGAEAFGLDVGKAWVDGHLSSST